MEKIKSNLKPNEIINNTPISPQNPQQDLIITNKQIEDLQHQLTSFEQIQIGNAIRDIIHFFKANRMNCQLFLSKYNSNLLIQLIKLYLQSISSISSENQSDSILDLIDIMYYYIGFSLTVPELIYQYLAQYCFKPNMKLTENIILRYLTLLNHLYGRPIISTHSPKNCFFYNGNGSLKAIIPKGSEIGLGEGFFLSTSFIIEKGILNEEAMIHLLKITTDTIQFSLSVKMDESVVFIVNNEIRNTICSLNANEWTCLSVSISKDFDKIISVKINQNPLFTYKLNFINKKSILTDMILFDNMIGESTSVIALNYPFTLENNSNRIFNSNQYGFCNRKSVNALLKVIPIDKITLFLSPIYPLDNRKMIDDLIGHYQFELVNDACLFRHKSDWKRVNLVSSINQLLPILELLQINNLYTEEIILSFLEVVLKIFKDCCYIDHNANVNADDKSFIAMMSIFFERMPNEIFTLKLLQMLLKIISSLGNQTIMILFYKEIILNEIILFKFPLDFHFHIWNNLNELFNQDPSQFLIHFPIAKLFVILLAYDSNRYNEYCCQSHYDSLIHSPNESSKIMTPSFNARTKSFMELIINVFNKIDISKSINDVVLMFEFLSMDLSPCLTKMILKMFIDFFTHKDIYMKFKSNEITKKIKFYEILINLLSTSLTDVKFDILSLILLSNKKKELDQIVIIGLGQFLLLSSGWYKPKDSVANADADDDVECKNNDSQSKELILNPEEYIKYKQNIHNILLKFLFNHTNTDLSIQYTIQSTNTIVNKGIIDIMIDYSEKNEKDGGLHLLKDFKDIFQLNLVNCALVFANEKLYMWLIRKMFAGFNNEQKDNENEKFTFAKDINNCILINTIQHYKVKKQNVQSFSFKKYNELFAFGANLVNNGTDSSLVNDFIRFVINDQFEALKAQILIKKGSNDPFYQAAVSLFSVSIDYMTVFNFKHQTASTSTTTTNQSNIVNEKESSTNHYAQTKGFPSIFCKCLNMNVNPSSDNLTDLWADYSLFNNFYSFFSSLWDKSTIQKYESKVKKDIIMTNEALLGNLLLNKNNQNLFIEQLEMLDLYSDKESILYFGNNVITCFGIILSIVKNKEEIDKWFEEFKYFILFYIIGTSNVQPKYQEQIEKSQNRAINLIVFSFVFLTELASIALIDKAKERAEYVLENIFSLCCMIISAINEDETKKFKITNLFSNPIQALKNTCIKKVFKDILVDNAGNAILTPARISDIKRQHYNNINQIFQLEPWLHSLISNAKIKLRIDTMFNINSYQRKKNDKDKLIQTHSQSDNNRFCDYITSVMKDIIRRKQGEICKWSNGSYRKKQIKQASYAAVKKMMFSWKGVWSNRTLFYDSIDKLKVKVMNHYSKAYSRPLLSVITDIDYYLPHFTEFNKEKLFLDKIDSHPINMNLKGIFLENSPSNNNDSNDNKRNLIHYIYSHCNITLWQLYSKCNDQAFKGKEDDLIELYTQKIEEKSDQHYPCCRIKQTHHIKGMLFFNQHHVSFWVKTDQINSTPSKDLDEYRKSCYGSYFPYHHRDKQHLSYPISYNQIKFVFRRTYYHKCSAIEIYLSNNKIIYFNFETVKDRESAFQYFISKLTLNALKFITVNTNYNDEFNNIIGFEVCSSNINTNFNIINNISNVNPSLNPFGKANNTTMTPSISANTSTNISIKSIIEGWKRNEISNFELIMYLNIFGGRSYMDLSQYPIFPWVLINYSADYISNDTDLRDLTIPVGMFCFNELTSKRKEVFLEIKDTQIEEKMQTHHLYSTHYSNPIYVSHFMVRLFPYSHTSIELQGKSFDNPDRLFISMEATFYSAMSQKGDVRELIPEFYYLPELFLNINKLNMGKVSSDNSDLNDVLCPNWCKNNPFYFVQRLREYLEHEKITASINKWIDLIFGKKQRGKEAEAENNLYFPESYGINIEDANDEEKTVYLRMVEFGISPKQVLSDEFPSKTPFKEKLILNSVLRETNRIVLKRPMSRRRQKLIGCEVNKDGSIMTMFNDNEYYIYNSINQSNVNQLSPKDIGKIDPSMRNMHYLCKSSEYYHQSLLSQNIPLKYNRQYNQIIQGGFFDGKITITEIDTSLFKETISVINMKNDCSMITAIDVDNHNGYIYAGNIQGKINVLLYDNASKKWTVYKQLVDGTCAVKSLFYLSELNVLASSFNDGYINLYTVPTFKLYRSMLLKDQSCDYVFASYSPVPLICVISLNTNSMYIYSINGSLINHEVEDPHPIKSPKLIRNSNFCEYLVYIIGHTIRIRSLPDFQIVNEIIVKADFNIEFINISEDGKTCYAINKEGTELIIFGNEINK